MSILQQRVLLLNGSTWEPLSVISVPRAMNLLLREKALIVEETGEYLRTVRTKFPIPSVIALRTYINVPRRQSNWSRRGVMMRDEYTCIYCRATVGNIQRSKVLSKSDMTIDHILPRSRNGKDTWSNTACACPHCNHRKGNRLPHEAGMKLLWEPKTPRTNYLVVEMGTGPDSWKRYVEFGWK